MDLYTGLTAFAVAFVVLAAVASVVALGVVGELLVRNRRVRLARHQTIRAYYRGLALSH
ncbi:hypothetical protein [Nocardioides aquiterrae]|uniref:Uncharacterized protein n=1 Tax=Nocardioides aquiterrae TaxID=203799 RepID=A0ABN1UAG6_9ACTN